MRHTTAHNIYSKYFSYNRRGQWVYVPVSLNLPSSRLVRSFMVVDTRCLNKNLMLTKALLTDTHNQTIECNR